MDFDTKVVNEHKLSEYIIDSCDEIFLEKLLCSWNNFHLMKDGRFELFSQAIDCYKDKKYAACVSLIICNFDGVISDINDYIDDNNVKINECRFLEIFKTIYPSNNSKDKEIIKKMNNRKFEKVKLISSYTLLEDEGYLWFIIFEYLIYEVLANNKFDSSIPCRNKICHGIQLNYNTKEHALKSILIIDLLISFYKQIYEIVNKEDLEN